MTALTGFQGTQNILVQNCYFRGYGRAIKAQGANGFIFRHNTWEGWHEDCFYVAGCNNMTIEYNFWNQSATISYRDAHYGWWYGAVGNSDQRPSAPVFSTAPGLDPRPEIEAGDVLTVTQGIATGTAPITRTNRWFRNSVLMTGQTGLTYTTVNVDDVITCVTRANNGIGGNVDSDASNAVTVITPVVVPPDEPPVFTTTPAINPASVVVGGVLTATQAVATGTAP
jgi:hypothetical protein